MAEEEPEFYLEPQVVFCFISHLSVVVGDVTLADNAVDGTLVWIGAIAQHAPVMQSHFILCSWRQAD